MQDDAGSWDRLLHVLEWLLDVELRHPGTLRFSMVYISFADKIALGNTYGAPAAFQMLVKLAHDLNRAMRKSDIVARNGTDFWVLIAHNEAELVVPKIAKIVEIAAANGLDVVDRDISVFSFHDQDIVKQNGLNLPLAFLDYVKNNRTIARSWPSGIS